MGCVIIYLQMVGAFYFLLKRTMTGQHSTFQSHTSTSSHFKRYCVPSTMNLAMKSGLLTSIVIMMIQLANIILSVAMWRMMKSLSPTKGMSINLVN